MLILKDTCRNCLGDLEIIEMNCGCDYCECSCDSDTII